MLIQMSNRRKTIYALFIFAVLVLALVVVQSAFANYRTERDGQVPF